MQKQKKANSTVVKVYTILNSLFKMAYLSDMIDRNPMDKVQRPKPRKDETKPTEAEAYTSQEMQAILAALDGEPLKWRCFVRLLVDTGIRRGEACALQWKGIDMKAGTALIHQNLCYTPSKGVYLGQAQEWPEPHCVPGRRNPEPTPPAPKPTGEEGRQSLCVHSKMEARSQCTQPVQLTISGNSQSGTTSRDSTLTSSDIASPVLRSPPGRTWPL